MGCSGGKASASTAPSASSSSNKPKGNVEEPKPAGLEAKPKAKPDAKPAEKAGKKPTAMPAPWVMELTGPCNSKDLLTSMLDQVFDQFDVNGDGNISREELSAQLETFLQRSDTITGKSVKSMVAESGLNPFLNMFDQLDANQDGKISRKEFQEQLQPAKAGKVIAQLLKEVFDGIDVNGDGHMSRDELAEAYGKLLNATEDRSGKNWSTLLVDAGMNPDFYVFEQLDSNADGKVTWGEFSSKLIEEERWVMEPSGGNAIEMVNAMLDQVFDKCDVNGDGNISREELASEMEKVLETGQTATGKSIKALVAESGLNPFLTSFDQLDANHDGKISRQEFKDQLQPARAEKPLGEMLKEIFDHIDVNGDGDISREELTAAYGGLLTTKEEKSGKYWYTLLNDAGLSPYFHVFEELDANNDGKITWEEFSSRLKPGSSKPDTSKPDTRIEISDESKTTTCCL